jgi:hypothetical protein
MAKMDFKKVLLEKGERVGLAAAVGLLLLLWGTNLFWPGRGIFSPAPANNAKELKTLTDKAKRELETSKPTDADKPDAKKLADADSFKFELLAVKTPEKFQVDPIWPPPVLADGNRRQPELFLPEEGEARVVLAQVASYIFNAGFTQIKVLKDDGMGGAPTGKDNLSRLQQIYGEGRHSGPRPGGGGPSGRFQAPTTQGLAAENAKPEKKVEMVSLDKLANMTGVKPAETIVPTPLAVIAAAFPYRAQIDEFRHKLRLGSRSVVLQEASNEMDPDTMQPLTAFRFLSVEVQRRIVDATGKPIKGPNSWETLDLEGAYRPLVFHSGVRTEPDDEKLAAISFDGLVMQRLLQKREGQYPKIEEELPKIKKTLADYNAAQVKEAAPASPFNLDTFNPFRVNATRQTGTGVPMPPNPRDIRGPGKPPFPPPPLGTDQRGVRPPIGDPNMQPGQDVAPPEYCLVRVVDPTIQPGFIYEYRLRVRMANPNYKRTDVASPKYAEDKELKRADDAWFVVPRKVAVPAALHFYAVDQKELDGAKDYKGINASQVPQRDKEVVVQIHKWVENAADKSGSNFPVGDWVVAERVLVGRGEPIGREIRVDVPIWSDTREDWIVQSTEVKGPTGAKKEQSGTRINFSQATAGTGDAIVIDFHGGDVHYERSSPDGKKERPVRDLGTQTEVLVCTSEGKFLALDNATDSKDEEREARLKGWRDRVKEAKDSKKSDKPMGGTPFGSKN